VEKQHKKTTKQNFVIYVWKGFILGQTNKCDKIDKIKKYEKLICFFHFLFKGLLKQLFGLLLEKVKN
jgi:hypothetical protein